MPTAISTTFGDFHFRIRLVSWPVRKAPNVFSLTTTDKPRRREAFLILRASRAGNWQKVEAPRRPPRSRDQDDEMQPMGT